jgi:parallel beta-helix repeat protein
VAIPAGDDSGTVLANNWTVRANTTYWFAPGIHTLGSNQYAQIAVAANDTFVGAPGAVLDGQGRNDYAFVADSPSVLSHVTIEYLTIQHFMAGPGEAVVGQGGYNGWTVKDNLIQRNPYGAGVAVATNGTVTDNCLYQNGEYGFNGWGHSQNVTLAYNDIADNNNAGYYDVPGSKAQCGCSGGGKFWITTNGTVTHNYVHGNVGPGIWVDTDNAGFDISDNYLADNWGEGIMYEASYNARITNNNLIRNGIGSGNDNSTPGFPGAAIYISESGADPRVESNFNQELLVSGNALTDNWGGIVLWENANRYCSDGSDSACTLVDPAVYSPAACAAHLAHSSPGPVAAGPDYWDNCRWKTQHVLVSGNTLTFSPSISPKCTTANLCGFNGLFSNYGERPYTTWVLQQLTFDQGNRFSDNSYIGPWHFWAWSQSNLDNPVSWSRWTRPVTDKCGSQTELRSGKCSSGFGQDSGSTLSP